MPNLLKGTGRPTWTWPNWRLAPPGTRFSHNQSGRLGTFVCPSQNRHNGAIVDWDDVGFGITRANVVSPARDLTPLEARYV